MKKTLMIIFILAAASCSDGPTGPTNGNPQYFTSPREEAYHLFLRNCSLEVADTIEVGKLQYSLDIAKSLNDTLLNIYPHPDYVLGDLILGCTVSIRDSLNDSTLFCGEPVLDSLIQHYGFTGVWFSMYRATSAVLTGPFRNNMKKLSAVFPASLWVEYAQPNWLFDLAKQYDIDINYIIENDTYHFQFYYYDTVFEIQVTGDQAEIIARRSRNL